jgi:ketosteroid isomerase-like protein
MLHRNPAAVTDALVERSKRQAQLFNSGRMSEWVELVDLDDEFTLMSPFGGSPSHGFDPSPENLARLSARFRKGGAEVEVIQVIASDDIIVLAFIERQETEVAHLPMQDWSLRVTLVYRRDGNRWRMAHRHADPLVPGITLEQAAALASARPLPTGREGQ